MNSYYLSVLSATSNGRFPELSDCWRTFHPFASMSDSDVLNDATNESPRCDSE